MLCRGATASKIPTLKADGFGSMWVPISAGSLDKTTLRARAHAEKVECTRKGVKMSRCGAAETVRRPIEIHVGSECIIDSWKPMPWKRQKRAQKSLGTCHDLHVELVVVYIYIYIYGRDLFLFCFFGGGARKNTAMCLKYL